jgi:cytochrome c oxidase assembly protein subunit 15
MSGMKAALFYPTWPLIGTEVIPGEIFESSNWSSYNFIHYDEHSFVISLIHTLHRFTAYLLFILIIWYGWRFRSFADSPWFRVLLLLLVTQVVLGIVVLVTSIGNISVLWGVLHQGVAVLLLGSLLCHIYFVRYKLVNTDS